MKMAPSSGTTRRRRACMDEARGDSRADGGDRFAYFMVCIHGGPADSRVKPSGIVERLGSGRKDAFSGAEELIRLLSEVPEGVSNMGRIQGIGNAGEGEVEGHEDNS